MSRIRDLIAFVPESIGMAKRPEIWHHVVVGGEMTSEQYKAAHARADRWQRAAKKIRGKQP